MIPLCIIHDVGARARPDHTVASEQRSAEPVGKSLEAVSLEYVLPVFCVQLFTAPAAALTHSPTLSVLCIRIKHWLEITVLGLQRK